MAKRIRLRMISFATKLFGGTGSFLSIIFWHKNQYAFAKIRFMIAVLQDKPIVIFTY